MKRINVTVAQAQKLHTGASLLWEETSLLYTKDNEGAFKGMDHAIKSFCKCPCHQEGNEVNHFLPCCNNDPDILYVIKSTDYKHA